jgi:hypothetical protein
MRAREIKNYESVLQLLGEPGCPICAFLKNTQANLLQSETDAELPKLCNAHMSGIAAVRPTAAAAKLFISLLEQQAEYPTDQCSFCMRLAEEEFIRLKELAGSFHMRSVMAWFKHHGVLCLPHGLKLREEAPPLIRPMIQLVLTRRSSELRMALAQLMTEAARGNTSQSGVLGKAVEYLVAQRGLPISNITIGPEGP